MISVTLTKQVEALNKELQQFANNIQNNIHIGALRVASNVIKDEIHAIDMSTSGDKGTYKKSLKKSDIKIKKRRRTKLGWERFKVMIRHLENEPQKEGSWHYNIITNSSGKERFADGNKGKTVKRIRKFTDDDDIVGTVSKKLGARSRGKLKPDMFVQRATKSSSQLALKGYIFYMRERIIRGGKIISAKTVNNAKKQGF